MLGWNKRIRATLLPSPVKLAMMFHEAYERLAPDFNYRTRCETAVSWDRLPYDNRSLMIATAIEVIEQIKKENPDPIRAGDDDASFQG